MRRVFGAILCLAMLAAVLVLPGLPERRKEPAATPAPSPPPEETGSGFGVWVSYLEWQQVDFSSAQAFGADIAVMLDNIRDAGGSVVFAQVRPFGDALYPSDYFPFSHLCTGTQGQDPGFDPLALLVEAAHARGLALEAWINPYRLQAGSLPSGL